MFPYFDFYVIMKNLPKYFIFLIVNIRSFFFLNFYKIINRNKKKIFIYTDSRGFQISKAFTRKSPFESYISHLVKNYYCEVYICPEKHTTIFDFLYQIKLRGGSNNYNYIIAHIGVVDFSPRPKKEVEPILKLKKEKIITVFGKDFFDKLSKLDVYSEEYMGDKTSSIISYNTISDISEKFNLINNFLWISCNPIDVNWRGNYMRDRPSNINIVVDKSLQLMPLIEDKVSIMDLTDWTIEQVHEYTCDNIHMSKKGMTLIKNKISEWLQAN